MPEQYYREAQRLAQKEYRSCIAKNQHPYLPVLDQLVPNERISMGVDLGIVQVPLEFVVGTRTAGRTTAFARNFMPLLDEKTEFGMKWEKLCQAHLREGIREPVKLYEYMNRYYVEEGNKRISVLKFFGAVSVPAQVTRVLPVKNGSKEVDIYYEFVEFYKYSKMNFIEFSKPGSYAELQRIMGKAPDGTWDNDERSSFRTTYHYFRQAYWANGGRRLRSTVGDAMLAYMKIYGYQALRIQNASEMKKSVAKVWEEITLQQQEQPVALKLDPEDKKKQGILSKVLTSSGHKELKVAFIYVKTPRTSGWTYGHELGRQHVQRVFKGKITTTAYEDATGDNPDTVIQKAITDGNTVIFTTALQLLPASLRVAVDHPEVTILNCSLNRSHRYIRTYYARMYEAKFVIGAIAGALAESDRVGYICDYPIFGMIAGINAFALGVQMVRPNAKVYLEWSSIDSIEAATQRLRDRGIDLISSQDMARLEGESRSNFGLSRINSDGLVNLAMPVWHWGVYYESIIRSILNRSFQSEEEEDGKALSYYWGMSAGVVELIYSSNLPNSTKKMAEVLRKAICNGTCSPFSGPLKTQNGQVIEASQDRQLSLEQIINMDWLAENVVGSIPSYEELNVEGKATVDMAGVKPSTKDKR